MSKEFFKMPLNEFLYDHDLNSLADLLNRHAEFNGLLPDKNEEKVMETSNPREFFL
ncbi:hypothetical protein LZ578_08605 [Jeotgalibaca sp. MA1X17-3]|uniref:hypothetical protein n=1 Tax=Jeotgalibaca sp. MA1X17-3 TaxID=2908211 RepID=UPI001F2F8362|nr:hypothetical protein [Jeotgalibaca sp. MA1X17-3]UJF15059.1 hypothetical protein LZ578_08605 [Jeotgalibaca sp. MA1X17-3]